MRARGFSGRLFALFDEFLPVRGELVLNELRAVLAMPASPAFCAFVYTQYALFGAMVRRLVRGRRDGLFFVGHGLHPV